MPALAGEKNTRYWGDQFQSKKGYITRHTWTAPLAAAAATIHALVNSNAVITTGITQPDFPRLLSIVGGGSGHSAAGTVTINGTDIRGNVIAETLTLNGNTTVPSTKAFASVTNIDMTAVTGNDVNNTVSVGISAKLGIGRVCTTDSVIFGTVNNTKEATVPIITSNTDIAKNVVSFNTVPDGSKNFVLVYETEELYAGK